VRACGIEWVVGGIGVLNCRVLRAGTEPRAGRLYALPDHDVRHPPHPLPKWLFSLGALVPAVK
jgi:hypothetical protein